MGVAMRRKRPPWLDDVPELLALLGSFLDKLDRRPAQDWKQPPSITLEAKAFPALFRLDETSDRVWQLFKALEADGVWAIHPDRHRGRFDAEFKGARVRLRLEAEALLRDWLGRPRQEPYAQQWQRAVDRLAHCFPGDLASLRKRPIPSPGRTADELVAAFAAVGELATQGLSLRQLSARCFWGNSKLLDSRQDLLQAVYPDLYITPRRLLVNIYLPPRFAGVLFIENLDSYLDALEQRRLTDDAGLILVYSAGFRSSAERVRQPDQVCIHYCGDATPEQRQRLNDWWFGEVEDFLPCHFWGDLDYAGIASLKALRLRFPGMQAWQPGYAPLLKRLSDGHRAEQVGKQAQVDPGESGCLYTDLHLLPAIRKHGRFVDQEVVTWKICMNIR